MWCSCWSFLIYRSSLGVCELLRLYRGKWVLFQRLDIESEGFDIDISRRQSDFLLEFLIFGVYTVTSNLGFSIYSLLLVRRYIPFVKTVHS